MENKINIAEILRDMPKGTNLYSPLFGKCEYIHIDNSIYPITIKAQSTDSTASEFVMTKDGRYFAGYEDAECLLFPSDRMRDWSKFFKRGDVLVDEDLETAVVFDGWANDDYTEFNTTIDYYKISNKKISNKWGKKDICCTLIHRKATDEERAEFIAAAEKHYGGKYNPETLQVEPIKVAEPKCLLKPFDKVLVRDSDAGIWKAAHFSHYIGEYEFPYFTTASAYKQCVPYDCNEYLLGTDKSAE